jgi:hypothetical protein
MAINVFQITTLHNNMLVTTGAQPPAAARASEFPVVADNLNGSLSRYTRLAGVWDSASIGSSPGSVSNASWGQANGSPNNDTDAYRPFGGYFIRGVWFTDAADGTNNYRSGYIGSFVGSLTEQAYGHDPNGSAVDYEPIYGHGAASWPMNANFNTQFRNNSSLPADGSAVVSNDSSAYSKSRYMPPSTFLVHVSSTTAALGSGNVRVFVEERPSLQIAGLGSHGPFDSSGTKRTPTSAQTVGNSGSIRAVTDPATSFGGPYTPNVGTNTVSPVPYPYEYFAVSGLRKLNSRAMSILLARIFNGNNQTGSGPGAYGFRYEEDATDMTNQTVDAQTEYLWQRSSTQAGATVAFDDFRVRNAATFYINEEYYGMVMDTKCLIFSNKASMIPLLFIDLTDTWGANNRIAGVAALTTQADPWLGHVYFLGEDGQLADYDFTATGPLDGGSISLMTAATSPTAGESYGALVTSNDGLKLYALYGTMTPDPRTTQTGLANDARIAIRTYTIGSDTWSALDISTLKGRHNARHLREMQIDRDGRLLIMCEAVTSVAGFNVTNALGSTNTAWQLMAYDPTATPKWNTTVIDGNTTPGTYVGTTGTISNLAITGTNTLTVTATHNLSPGDFVTFGGITNAAFKFLNGVQVKVATAPGGSFTAVFNHANISAAVSAGTAKSGLQYGQDYTGDANGDTSGPFWYWNPNCHAHAVLPDTVLLQGNWTCGALYTVVLPTVGTTPDASSVDAVSCLTQTISNIVPTGLATIQGGGTGVVPCDIRHNRDFATGGSGADTGDRTIFWSNRIAPTALGSGSTGAIPLYYAAPSFTFDGTARIATWTDRNATDTSGYLTSIDKDKWSFGSLRHSSQNPAVLPYWAFPTQFYGNTLHFVKIDGSGNTDSVPGSSIYGKFVTQTLAYVPTYWMWDGAAWTLADDWTQASNSANGYPVSSTPATSTPLVWGLAIQFTAGSYGLGEFHTFNTCWGNTKFARKVRFPWAMFAGQTLLYTDTRTLATQNALALILNETDHSTVVVTGPDTITNPANGWNSLATFPKLKTDDSPNNAAIVMEITCANFDPSSLLNAPMASNTTLANGDTTTQVASAISHVGTADAWFAFSGNPGKFWRSATAIGSNPWLDMDFGSGVTVLAYSFRSYYGSSDAHTNAPITWALLGSATGVFGGEELTVDTRTTVTPARGYGFVCNGTTGSYRYYRLRFTATSGSAAPYVGMVQFYSSATKATMNFVDLSFLPHGDNKGTAGYDTNFASDDNLFLNSQFARGLTFEVFIGAGPYAPITPNWRSHNGYVYSFDRQEAVVKLRITFMSPYNYGTGQEGNTNSTLTAAVGPIYTYDYGVNQATLDAARLGNSGVTGQTPTNPAAGSFETPNLGVAVDAVTISIDGGSPNQLSPVFAQNTFNGTNYIYAYTAAQIEKWAVLGFWDFNTVPSGCFKVHPYFGFVFFEGAGASNSASLKSGTNMDITYHWGRRI